MADNMIEVTQVSKRQTEDRINKVAAGVAELILRADNLPGQNKKEENK